MANVGGGGGHGVRRPITVIESCMGFQPKSIGGRLQMIRFLIGFLAAVVLVLLALFCYVRFGFVDPRADAEPGSLETKLAMPALDASVDRRAPDVKNPIQLTDENLMAGMKIYQSDCAGCHGDISHAHSPIGDSFYPRAPQFVEDAPDMPENQNFYIIQHGVRLSGMPGWKTSLKEPEVWQVTTFLSNMNKLPPPVLAAWKTASVEPGTPGSTDAGTKAATKDSHMDMPTH
jgi:thiosulfate dehydrogenase